MSVLNTVGLKVAPSSAANINVADGGAFTFGGWVEFIASTGGVAAIAGFQLLHGSGTYANAELEFQIGVGGSGSEVALGIIRVYGINSAVATTPDAYMLPVPMGGIGAGVRVSVRFRYTSTGYTPAIALLYYEGLSSDYVTSVTEVYSCVPVGAVGVAVTPSSSLWANSNWFELTSGLGTTAGIYGVAVKEDIVSIGYEYDLGIGGSGSESVITTIRSTKAGNANLINYNLLPGVYFVPASTRISIRIRRNSTSVTPVSATLLYIAGVSSGNNGNGGGNPKGNNGKGHKGIQGKSLFGPSLLCQWDTINGFGQ